MKASFNLNTTVRNFPFKRAVYPPQIHVANLRIQTQSLLNYTVSSNIETHELVYAVPRVSTASVEWFRILNELSAYVWFALIVILLLSVGTLYLLAHDGKDLVYIIMFTVQPLFGFSWGTDFLSWRGRVIFATWLYFCVILSTSYMSTFLSKLTVPSTSDAIKSFDDLVKSGLPVRALMHENLAKNLVTLPLFQPIMNRTTFHFRRSPEKDRHDIAYLIQKSQGYEFVSMPYRLLPEIVHVFYIVPVQMTRYAHYEQIFEIAFMRVAQAGGLKMCRRYQKEHSKARGLFRRDHRKPFPVRSLRAVFVVWSIGCGVALFVFVLEYCVEYLWTKPRLRNLM